MADCKKVRYSSKLEVKIALANTQLSRSPKREERRCYRCPECKGFHLTSMKRGDK